MPCFREGIWKIELMKDVITVQSALCTDEHMRDLERNLGVHTLLTCICFLLMQSANIGRDHIMSIIYFCFPEFAAKTSMISALSPSN